jgi:hypothetical protein
LFVPIITMAWCNGDTRIAVVFLTLVAGMLAVALVPGWTALPPRRVRATVAGIETDHFRVDRSEAESVRIYVSVNQRSIALHLTPPAYSRITSDDLHWPRWYAGTNTMAAGKAAGPPHSLEAPVAESVLEFLPAVYARRTGPEQGRRVPRRVNDPHESESRNAPEVLAPGRWAAIL